MKNIKILQSNKICKDFYGAVFFVKEREQNNLLEYKGKSWMSMPLMEKGGVFTEPVFFPIPSPCDVNQNIPLAICFF